MIAFFFALAALFTVAPQSRAAEESGTVFGRVVNESTGVAVSSARVSVEGTSLTAVSDVDGSYRLRNVPIGDQILLIEYGGSGSNRISVDVQGGQAVARNVSIRLRGSELAGTEEDGVFELDPFEVKMEGEFNAAVMATNAERFSTNIVNVVSTDQFGDNTDGNLGEFIKFLPGVDVQYGVGSYGNGADAGAVGIRGFGPEQTQIMVDGMPITGSSPGSLTRAVGLDMISVNNASRIEVTKIATPDMPDGAAGGSINLISRTAFEYPQAQLSWRTYLSLNSDNLSSDHLFSKTPGPTNKNTLKGLPGFDFSYVKPVNEKFGFSINGQFSQQYNENHTAKAQWDYDLGDKNKYDKEGNLLDPDGDIFYNDVTNPFLKTISITDAPRLSTRTGFGGKVDWRPAEGHSLSLSLNYSEFEGTDSNRRLQVKPDQTEAWGMNPDGSHWVQSKSGKGKTDMNIDFLDREGDTLSSTLKYELDKGPWKVGLIVSNSDSSSQLESTSNNHFSVVELSTTGIGNMFLDNIVNGIPFDVNLLDKSGNSFNLYDISNYKVNNLEEAAEGGSKLVVRGGQSNNKSVKTTYKFDVTRDLDFISSDAIRLSAKAGLYREVAKEEKWGKGVNYSYRYTGPVDAFDASVYADDVYVQQDPGFGFSPMTWVDPYKMYDFFQANPNYFSDTEDIPVNGLSMAAQNYNEYVNSNKTIKETKDSYYAMIEGKMLNGKLSFITGARWSESAIKGAGPRQNSDWELIHDSDGKVWYYQKQNSDGEWEFNDDGTPTLASLKVTADNTGKDQYILDQAAEDGIDLTHVVTKNTLEAKQREVSPLYPINSKTSTDPAYSFTTAYEITPKLTARLGYSHSNGSPDYEGDGILTKVQYNEDSDGYGGTISVGNPNLKPWIADNYDLQLAYYTDLGGKIKVSYFTKEVENYAVTESIAVDNVSILALYNLSEDDYYVNSGWVVKTSINGEGTSKTDGYEFEVNQSLGLFGDFGEKFNVYGSYTTKKTEQENTSRVQSSPDNSAGAGISFRSGRFRADVRATFRSENITKFTQVKWLTDLTDRNSVHRDADGEEIKAQLYYREPPETKVDVNLNYQLNDRYGLFYSARNVTNTQRKKEIVSDVGVEIPSYMNMEQIQDFGFNMQLGIRGTF